MPGQCTHGELLQFSRSRARASNPIHHTARGQSRILRVHRDLLQSPTAPLEHRIPHTSTSKDGHHRSSGCIDQKRPGPASGSNVTCSCRRERGHPMERCAGCLPSGIPEWLLTLKRRQHSPRQLENALQNLVLSSRIFQQLDFALVRWAKRKYKRKGSLANALAWLCQVARREPKFFAHWPLTLYATAG